MEVLKPASWTKEVRAKYDTVKETFRAPTRTVKHALTSPVIGVKYTVTVPGRTLCAL